MSGAIWWLRRDLRLADNQALEQALEQAAWVLPLFILDPQLLTGRYASAKRSAFLYGALADLDQQLRRRGSRLLLRRGQPAQVLAQLLAESGAEVIYAEADHSPYAARRDRLVATSLPLRLAGSPTLHPPGTVLKADGTPYTVFTPYSRAWKQLPQPQLAGLPAAPKHLPAPPSIDSLDSLALPDLPLPASVPFPPSSQAAQQRLETFVDGAVYRYRELRDRMDLDGTSRLSPYLRFGLLSARQAIAAAAAAIQAAPDPGSRQGAETWLNELIWREFYFQILEHFPQVRQGNFRMAGVAWENDRQAFQAWCEARTGYPVVDAAMRQLVSSGWMHNRARMIVASFLTKDLLIDWRWGEQFFMQHLVDGDPAANNGGWQWTAGTGTDAAPYFRVFNPLLQSQRYDPDGVYIRRWLPELARLPQAYIHAPSTMPVETQRQLGFQIGRDYPAPIVEHAWAKERALAAYAKARS